VAAMAQAKALAIDVGSLARRLCARKSHQRPSRQRVEQIIDITW
jgi:hypothetical protein